MAYKGAAWLRRVQRLVRVQRGLDRVQRGLDGVQRGLLGCSVAQRVQRGLEGAAWLSW